MQSKTYSVMQPTFYSFFNDTRTKCFPLPKLSIAQCRLLRRSFGHRYIYPKEMTLCPEKSLPTFA